MNFKYYLGVLLTIPILPLLYYQGKKVKTSVPKLPEANGTEGSVNLELSAAKSIRLITIGESTIAGVGVETHEEGFTGTLAKELANQIQSNISWRVYAHSGYTAEKVWKDIIPQIEEKGNPLIVIGLGANDAFQLSSPNKWKTDIQGLIASLRSKYPSSLILFCNMPPIKEFPAFTSLIKFTIGNLIELLGQELNELVKNYDDVYYFNEIITIEEWRKKLQIDEAKSSFFSDGVHPSKLTYQSWAKDVAGKIASNKEMLTTLNGNT
jgi:lysophospholipase L1-like esterase